MKIRAISKNSYTAVRRIAVLLILVTAVFSAVVFGAANGGTGQLGQAGQAGQAGQGGQVSKASGDIIEKSKDVRRAVKSNNMSSLKGPAGEEAGKGERRLDILIEQLERLRVPVSQGSNVSQEPEVPQQTSKTAEDVQKDKPTDSLTVKGTADKGATEDNSGPNKPDIKVRLGEILQKPDSVVDAIALADVLFSSGEFAEAAKFYQMAYSSLDKQDPDRQWALFQAANSVRASDTKESARFYEQLLSEYPESPWSVAAGARLKIVRWYGESAVQDTLKTAVKG